MAQELNNRWRWSLRTLLLIVLPLCAGLAYQAAEARRIMKATHAWGLMASKGIVSPEGAFVDGVFHFKQGAVSDADLVAFISACNGPLPNGLGTIRVLELNGSKVSDEAIARFRRGAPGCEVRR